MERNITIIATLIVILIAGSATTSAAERLRAFPGAEGFGSESLGGRGGRVIKVTNLNNGGPGSLQAACSSEGARTIVFDVSGVIEGDVTIEHGRVSILGQTAPGPGATIAGMLSTRYNPPQVIEDVVVRFLRVRPTDSQGNSGDALQFSQVERVVLDHISYSWAIANGPADIRNNVLYNFRDGLSHEGHPPNNRGINLIGNYYKRGPSDSKIFPFCFRGEVSYFLRDNFIEGVGMIQDPWAEANKLSGLKYYAGHGRKADDEFPVAKVTTHSPQAAYQLVLQRAGRFPRDVVTRRIVREVRIGTGQWGRAATEEPLEQASQQNPPQDSDQDGMPNVWEAENGLDSNDPSDHRQVMPSGYTAIEEYCHQAAQEELRLGLAE